MIDVAISLEIGSTPDKDPDEDGEIDPNPPAGVSSGPNYPTKYRLESPFGGNSPNYK